MKMTPHLRLLKSPIKKTKSVKPFFRVAPVCLMTWVALSYITPVQAKVIADVNQVLKPGVTLNSNNSTTVNINAAYTNGISHNKFTQFDVSKHGLVLNNSAETSKTNIGGIIAGNSNMANGPAGLIINEVTSNRGSLLNGMIEVAGKKASVIIANPSGINCDGCGFINTGRSTLTTGKVKLNNDDLSGINVSSGNISFSGKGMNDNSDYTSFLARAIIANAKIETKDLQVAVGTNNYVMTGNNRLFTGHWNTSSSPVDNTLYALDVSYLGSMYANKITLMANNPNVGIRNGGIISATSNLYMDVNGNIINSGHMEGASRVTTNAIALNNSGKISGGVVNLNTKTNLTNSGKISASSALKLTGNLINNNRSEITSDGDINITAGQNFYNNSGLTFTKNGTININSIKTFNDAGLISGNGVNIASNSLSNNKSKSYISPITNIMTTKSGGIIATNDINIESSLINIDGNIHSDSGNISVLTTGNVNNHNSQISGKNITINSINSNLSGARITADNNISLHAKTVSNYENTGTVINAGKNLSITSETGYTNYASLNAGNNLKITSTGNFTNLGSIIGNNDITITAQYIGNNKNITTDGDLTLSSQGIINNSRGATISSGGKTKLLAPTNFYNAGNILATQSVDIQSPKISNKGYISYW
ncbi:filamentous hemagglutinin N-terminal domain-containing protein [Erwinia sorbitola]|uniref:Filamentous hemagglutinin N-terminal domain-containing protein n=2 Tax=Erwinia sorbitola TaxID=2681984 RepID=A0A6I6EQ21_9GAMM|nr:filamentous hemagglutinin N-terminal domain-containing protein [Erwinia sorbitola]